MLYNCRPLQTFVSNYESFEQKGEEINKFYLKFWNRTKTKI